VERQGVDILYFRSALPLLWGWVFRREQGVRPFFFSMRSLFFRPLIPLFLFLGKRHPNYRFFG
jgi:hypothetical protein